LEKALSIGLLPSIYFSGDPIDDLKAYVGTYLKEEVAAEGLTRNIPAFSRFLEVAALCHGKVVNYSNIASDAEVGRTTVQNYFEILKDTLILSEISPWSDKRRRQATPRNKIYFFDQGVVNTLQNVREIRAKSPLFGDAFESFIFHELSCFNEYIANDQINFWRSDSGLEVDFVLRDRMAVEVKAKESVSERDLVGIRQLKAQKIFPRHIVVTMEQRPRIVDGIELMPLEHFLAELWEV